MTEALDKNQENPETLADDLRIWIERLIGQCEDEIRILESGHVSLMTAGMSELDPAILDEFIKLTRQEAEVLRALNPHATSKEEVQAIMRGFTKRRNALTPNY